MCRGPLHVVVLTPNHSFGLGSPLTKLTVQGAQPNVVDPAYVEGLETISYEPQFVELKHIGQVLLLDGRYRYRGGR